MVYNVRSPKQWSIISEQVDFKDKTVLDLGCGKGDILLQALDAGASAAGVDSDKSNLKYIWYIHPELAVIEDDIEILGIIPPTDIIICFSVLPYLKNPEHMLEWINLHSVIAFIECQYAGDGPGFSFLTDNEAMKEWLLAAGQFEKVQPIGHTFVEGRNKNRFIWMCE